MNIEKYELGRSLDSFNYQQVQDEIEAILEKGCHAVIDMSACNYISSIGLRVLLCSKKIADAKGLMLYLVGIDGEVKEIMDVTGFNTFFDCYSTMEEVLEKIKD